VELWMESAIDAQGFGVRPEHVRVWLSEHLERPLRLGRPRREALLLRPRAQEEDTTSEEGSNVLH